MGEFIKENMSIRSTAKLWITRIEDGLSIAEKRALVIWCNQNNEHYQTILSLCSSSMLKNEVNSLHGLFVANKSNKPPRWSIQNIAAAATVIIALVGTANVFNWQPTTFFNENVTSKIENNTIFSTDFGEQKQLSLSDGSSVKLNTNTIIKVNYTNETRALTLVQGEAIFDVSSDINRPFSVTSGSQSFTALGTVFNIEKKSDLNMELIVTHGKVLITEAGQHINKSVVQSKMALEKDLPGLLVSQGEKAVIANNIHAPLLTMSSQQTQQDLAWEQGVIIFDGVPLTKALDEISRYKKVNFVLSDEELAQIKISGFFKTNDLASLLQSLNYNFSISYTKSNEGTYILSRNDNV